MDIPEMSLNTLRAEEGDVEQGAMEDLERKKNKN